MAVVVTGRKLVTELAAFPEDMMSLDVATNEVCTYVCPGRAHFSQAACTDD
jgi:hypothetical protein